MSEVKSRAIVGGGLAGLSLALSLVEAGVPGSTLTIIDGGDERRGSSAPATMLHPFPGRTMSLRRGQDEAFVQSWKRLKSWTEKFGHHWWQEAKMIRPLTDDERGDRLRQSWEKKRAGYPQLIDVIELSPEQIRAQLPELTPSAPALLYEPAAAVILPQLLDVLTAALRHHDVRFIDRNAIEISNMRGTWHLTFFGDSAWLCDEVVLAVGASLDRFFPGLDLRRKAGEVAVLDGGGRQLPAMINGVKHLFERPDGYWGLGSTYFPVEEWDERSDEEVVAQLKGGVADIFPAVEDAAVVEVWRGTRGVFGSDHMPLVGPIPGQKGLYSFAAFGSKGLLWAPWAAQKLAQFIMDEKSPLPPHMDTRRVRAEKWRF